MKIRSTFVLLAGALGLMLAACGHVGSIVPAAPMTQSILQGQFNDSAKAPNVAGTYSGTITDSHAGKGTLVLVVTQNGSTIGGTATPTFRGGSATFQIAGRVFVANKRTRLSFVASLKGTHCTAKSTGTVTRTHHLSGKYTATGCAKKLTSGTYTTVKQ